MSVALAIGLLAALVAAGLFGIAAVVQAHGVRSGGDPIDTLRDFVRSALRNRLILLVVAAYLAGFVLHAVSIWYLPLYLAQATVALSLPVTALSASRLRERLGGWEWAAIAAIVTGLVLVVSGSADPGPGRSSPLLAALLWAGVLLLVVAGLLSSRLGAAALGTVAGLGYAGSAISVRGVVLPLEAPAIAAALAVPAYGLLAFWLYSLALNRATVVSSTAPLVVGQTLVPALVGLWALGDTTRSGWEVTVVVGMACAVSGAIHLGRTTAGPPAADGPATLS